VNTWPGRQASAAPAFSFSKQSSGVKRSIAQIIRLFFGSNSRDAGADASVVQARLGELAARRDPRATPYALTWVFSEDRATSRRGAEGLDRMLAAMRPLDLLAVDEWIRRASDYEYGAFEWRGYRDRRLIELAQRHASASPLGILCSHPNGYVRETAIIALAERHRGDELPFLLIRLNDWVEAVRRRARATVEHRIRLDYVPHWVKWLPLLDRLLRQSRDDHREIVDRVRRLLTDERARAGLLSGLDSPHRETRRLVLAVLLNHQGDRNAGVAVVERTQADPDPIMRLRAIEWARQQLHQTALPPILSTAEQDRFMPVRREALYGWLQRFPETGSEKIWHALRDPNPGMRELARFSLRERDATMDLPQFYRSELARASGAANRAVALNGLAETGSAADAASFLQYLCADSAEIRLAAVRGLVRLDPERHVAELHAALGDRSPRVARTAHSFLRRNHHLVDPQVLLRIITSPAAARSRMGALQLLADVHWTVGLPGLIRASALRDPAIAEAAGTALARWRSTYNRLLGKPNHQQLQRIREALREVGENLHPEVRDEVMALIHAAH
jgi:HEAT repeat protein